MAAGLELYIVASLALIATPGQDMIYVITRALAQGRIAGLCSALGVSLGILVHTAFAALGIGAILLASESLFLALKLVGAGYLLYLGARMLLTDAGAQPGDRSGSRFGNAELVWQGMLSNVSNPKIVLFFFAFLPQFVDAGSRHPALDIVQLGVLYALLALPVKGAVALAAAQFSQRALNSPATFAWLQRAGGAVLLFLGLRIAIAERS